MPEGIEISAQIAQTFGALRAIMMVAPQSQLIHTQDGMRVTIPQGLKFSDEQCLKGGGWTKTSDTEWVLKYISQT